MNRRTAVATLASFVVGLRPAPTAARNPEPALPPRSVGGRGPWLMTLRRDPAGFFEPLRSRYRVIEVDYPPSGVSQDFIAAFTPDRVCADLLAVADAEGADRFAWFGFSWGAVVGLQLAARTSRLTALACGGWPPLGARYAAMVLPGGREGDARMYDTFYGALKDWPEADVVTTFRMPRLAFAGAADVIEAYGTTFPLGPTISARRAELERLGWQVRLVDGLGHELGGRPDLVLPLLREFLDPLPLPAAPL